MRSFILNTLALLTIIFFIIYLITSKNEMVELGFLCGFLLVAFDTITEK
jgi:hypothetical protein